MEKKGENKTGFLNVIACADNADPAKKSITCCNENVTFDHVVGTVDSVPIFRSILLPMFHSVDSSLRSKTTVLQSALLISSSSTVIHVFFLSDTRNLMSCALDEALSMTTKLQGLRTFVAAYGLHDTRPVITNCLSTGKDNTGSLRCHTCEPVGGVPCGGFVYRELGSKGSSTREILEGFDASVKTCFQSNGCLMIDFLFIAPGGVLCRLVFAVVLNAPGSQWPLLVEHHCPDLPPATAGKFAKHAALATMLLPFFSGFWFTRVAAVVGPEEGLSDQSLRQVAALRATTLPAVQSTHLTLDTLCEGLRAMQKDANDRRFPQLANACHEVLQVLYQLGSEDSSPRKDGNVDKGANGTAPQDAKAHSPDGEGALVRRLRNTELRLEVAQEKCRALETELREERSKNKDRSNRTYLDGSSQSTPSRGVTVNERSDLDYESPHRRCQQRQREAVEAAVKDLQNQLRSEQKHHSDERTMLQTQLELQRAKISELEELLVLREKQLEQRGNTSMPVLAKRTPSPAATGTPRRTAYTPINSSTRTEATERSSASRTRSPAGTSSAPKRHESPAQSREILAKAHFTTPTSLSQQREATNARRPRLASPAGRAKTGGGSSTPRGTVPPPPVIVPSRVSPLRSDTAFKSTQFSTTYRPTRLVRHAEWENPADVNKKR